MSVPPPPQHPPPRRQPHAPEDPSLTTQIFIDQSRAAAGRADAGQANAGGHRSADRGQQVPPAEDADTQALSPGDVAEARRRAAEDDGESTQMMSMEDLRQLAASSRIEALDGPREGSGDAVQAPPAGAADDARAQEQAPPGVFSAHVPSHPAPSAPDAPPTAPHAAQPHAAPAAPQTAPPHAAPSTAPAGYPAAAGYAVQSGHPAPPAKPTAPPPAAGGGYAAAGQAEPVRRKRRMPVLAIAFVVLSALIVVGIGGWILVDAVTRDGGQSQQAAPPPPATDDSTGEGGLVDESDDGTAAPGAGTESFATPSGNIGCTIDAERARCVVKSFDYSPPAAPDSCEMAEWGSIVVANRDGAGFSCTPAEFPADAEPLEYGQTITAHGMTCSSEETGVSCRSDETGAAFSVARADATFDQAE